MTEMVLLAAIYKNSTLYVYFISIMHIFPFSFVKLYIQKFYLNKFKLHHLSLCVNKSL